MLQGMVIVEYHSQMFVSFVASICLPRLNTNYMRQEPFESTSSVTIVLLLRCGIPRMKHFSSMAFASFRTLDRSFRKLDRLYSSVFASFCDRLSLTASVSLCKLDIISVIDLFTGLKCYKSGQPRVF